MREARSALAPGRRPAPPAVSHLVPLAGEWALWCDIAVRTAGIPVSGLGIFGSPDEQAGLRAVASDPHGSDGRRLSPKAAPNRVFGCRWRAGLVCSRVIP
jgi:hypothetical protein